MLLHVQQLGRNNFIHMISNVVANHKRKSLAGFNFNAGNKTLAKHPISSLLGEANVRSCFPVGTLGDHIELQLDIFAVESCDLALLGHWTQRLLVDGGDMDLLAIAKRGENFHI